MIGPRGGVEQLRDLGRRWPRLEVDDTAPPAPRADLVPEHPGELLVFVAGFLEAFGEELRAGDLVLSGSYLGSALPVQPGSSVRAHFGLLGDVEVSFAD